MNLLVLAALIAGLTDRSGLVGDHQADYERWLATRVRAYDASFNGAPCPASRLTSIELFAPRGNDLTDEMQGVMTGPAVIERIKVEGCGRVTVANVLAANTAQGMASWPMPPGFSRASPRLSADVFPVAARLALAALKPGPCRDAPKTAADFRIGPIALRTPPDARGEWSEHWPVTVCGEAHRIRARFVPTADGGADYGVSLDE